MTFLNRLMTLRNPPRPGPKGHFRPALEPLEDRWVPAGFIHPTTITVPDSGPGAPYPANIVVSGMAGTVSKVTVKLEFIYHNRPDDLDVLLVAPNGANAILMSDVGGDHPVSILLLTL